MGYDSKNDFYYDLINGVSIKGTPIQDFSTVESTCGKNLFAEIPKTSDEIHLKYEPSPSGTVEIKFNENKEENKMNCTEYEPVGVRKILKIYKEREYEYIDQEYIAARNEIIEKDKIHAIYLEYVDKIKEAYEKDWKKEMPYGIWQGMDIFTSKTEEKLKEIEEERCFNEHNLEEKLEEVEARLEMTSDYDKQIEILKTYEILDEEGRINA